MLSSAGACQEGFGSRAAKLWPSCAKFIGRFFATWHFFHLDSTKDSEQCRCYRRWEVNRSRVCLSCFVPGFVPASICVCPRPLWSWRDWASCCWEGFSENPLRPRAESEAEHCSEAVSDTGTPLVSLFLCQWFSYMFVFSKPSQKSKGWEDWFGIHQYVLCLDFGSFIQHFLKKSLDETCYLPSKSLDSLSFSCTV